MTSIAVLPFVNMSDDPANDYFSDGLAEELLNRLATIPRLRVTSRSSAFAFKGLQVPIVEVADRLGVGHVLEGSVRQAGDRVRITAQLIDAEADAQLWSRTWDRTLDDVFAIQDEIAGAVLEELEVTLSQDAARSVEPIDPSFGSAFEILGLVEMMGDGDLAASAAHLESALELAPGDAEVIGSAAVLFQFLGRLEQSIALRERVVALDPVNPSAHYHLGLAYEMAGRPDEAIVSLRAALALSPDLIVAKALVGQALLDKGEPDLALEAIRTEPFEPYRLVSLAVVYHALGESRRSDDALDELIDEHAEEAPYNIATVLAYRGEADRAFRWLERAAAEEDPGLNNVVAEPFFDSLREDPRWRAFLEDLGRSPAQLAAIEFDVRLPEI